MAQIRVTVGSLRSALRGIIPEARFDDPNDKSLKQSKWQGLRPKEHPEVKQNPGLGHKGSKGMSSPKLPEDETIEALKAKIAAARASKASSMKLMTPYVQPENVTLSDFETLLPRAYRSEIRSPKDPSVILRHATPLDPTTHARWERMATDYTRQTGQKAPTPQEVGRARDERGTESLMSKYAMMKPAAAAGSAGVHAIKQRPENPAITKSYVGKSIQAPYLKGKTGTSSERENAGVAAPNVYERPFTMEELESYSPKAARSIPPGDWSQPIMRGPYVVLYPRNTGEKPLIWANFVPPPNSKRSPKQWAWRTADELSAQQVRDVGLVGTTEKGAAERNAPVMSDEFNGLRLKGGAGGRVDVNATGTVQGGATGPGGIPTLQARQSAEQVSPPVDIPDWDTFDLPTLKKLLDKAFKKFGDGSSVVSDIRNALVDRQAGQPPLKSVRTPLPKSFQNKDARDVIRALEAGDNERAATYLNVLPFKTQGPLRRFVYDVFGSVLGGE